jgi:hypothetical protein
MTIQVFQNGPVETIDVDNSPRQVFVEVTNGRGPQGVKGDPGQDAVWGLITGAITNQLDLISYVSTNFYPRSSNPAGYLTTVSFSSLTGKPTTTAGYGITDTLSQTLAGYVSGPGAISSSDSILTAIEKLNGNVAALVTGVSSFNTRTGAVVLSSSDVTSALTFTPYNSTNPNGYISSVPAQSFASLTGKPTTISGYGITDTISQPLTGYASTTGVITSGDTILSAIEKLNGNISGAGAVTSVFGRTGAVVAASNDYTFAQLASKPTTISGYGITDTISQVLTGYVSGSGTISATDTILGAIQKLNGNDGLKAPLASPTFTGTVTLPAGTVINSVLTGYVSGSGTVSATDSILQAIQKLNGNDGLKAPLASPTFTGTVTLPAGTVINSVITGYTSGAGTVSATDSILQAIQKLNGNIGAIVSGVSSVSNSDSSLTVSPTTGAVIASINLANANLWTSVQTVTKTALATTPVNAILLQNTTAAAAAAQQVSPYLTLTGQGWKTTATAASQSVAFSQYVLPVQGAASPGGQWVLGSSVNAGSFTPALTVDIGTGNGAFLGIGSQTTPAAPIDVNYTVPVTNTVIMAARIFAQNNLSGATRTSFIKFGIGGAANACWDWFNDGFGSMGFAYSNFTSALGTQVFTLDSSGNSTFNGRVTASGHLKGVVETGFINDLTNAVTAISITSGTGNVGIGGTSSSSALLNVIAGTATVAPFRMAPGTLLTTPVSGVVENDTNHIYYTAGGVRFQLDQQFTATKVEEFVGTGSGTWTKATGAKMVRVLLIGAGGGGGSGAVMATGILATGGAAGGGGGWTEMWFNAADLGATEPYNAVAGGAGGVGISANSTAGNAGASPNPTTFGAYLAANGGGGGAGGTNSGAANGGGGGVGLNNAGNQQNGAGSSASGGGGGSASNSFMSPSGGGSGGGITTANAVSNGGFFGAIGAYTNPTNNYGTSFTQGQAGFKAGALPFGTGGSGTASLLSGTTAAGGAGNRGGGGAGSGAARNGGASGAGGQGGHGVVRIETYF